MKYSCLMYVRVQACICACCFCMHHAAQVFPAVAPKVRGPSYQFLEIRILVSAGWYSIEGSVRFSGTWTVTAVGVPLFLGEGDRGIKISMDRYTYPSVEKHSRQRIISDLLDTWMWGKAEPSIRRQVSEHANFANTGGRRPCSSGLCCKIQ